MSSYRMATPRRTRLVLLIVLSAAVLGGQLLVACGSSDTGVGGHVTTGREVGITLGLSYIPNIQFAPFYVAEQRGFFAQEGLNVTLHHHSLAESEFGDINIGREDVLYAGGDEVLQARATGVQIVDVATLYQQYPICLITAAGSHITSARDLRGHTIGVPGPYGETYFGLLALLQSAGLGMSDVHIENIGFTQVAALASGKVDAVMGYLNNEAVQLGQAHFATRVFPLTALVHQLPLVAAGLAVRQPFLSAHAASVRKLVTAVIDAERYVAAHPQEALDISRQYIPGLADPAQEAEAAKVLEATIPLWGLGGHPGYNDDSVWRAMAAFMLAHKFLPKQVNYSGAFSSGYL